MSPDIYSQIACSPQFRVLTTRRSRFAWGLAGIMLTLYFAFILTIAFVPEALGTPVLDGGVMSVGIPVGVAIIVIAFILTGIYVHRANGEFDRLTREIVQQTSQHHE